VNEKIQALGGSVVPKLNWSTPTDAIWVTGLKKIEIEKIRKMKREKGNGIAS